MLNRSIAFHPAFTVSIGGSYTTVLLYDDFTLQCSLFFFSLKNNKQPTVKCCPNSGICGIGSRGIIVYTSVYILSIYIYFFSAAKCLRVPCFLSLEADVANVSNFVRHIKYASVKPVPSPSQDYAGTEYYRVCVFEVRRSRLAVRWGAVERIKQIYIHIYDIYDIYCTYIYLARRCGAVERISNIYIYVYILQCVEVPSRE